MTTRDERRVSRREFLTGAEYRRSRADAAQPEAEVPETAPEIPNWDESLEHVLAQMNNVAAIDDEIEER